MLYYIGNHLKDTVEALSYLRLLDSISFRALGGAITSLMFIILFGNRIILYFYRAGQRDASRSYAHFPVGDHQTKTYGGGLLVTGILLSTVLWCQLHNRFVLLCVAAVVSREWSSWRFSLSPPVRVLASWRIVPLLGPVSLKLETWTPL